MKRNDIVELGEWFNVDCDYRHDYLITFDLESMMQKINETQGDKLTFVSKHIPVSASIATNVSGFESEYFILSTDPHVICKQMFEYFDKVAEKSKLLMTDKLKGLIKKLNCITTRSKRKRCLAQLTATVQIFQ